MRGAAFGSQVSTTVSTTVAPRPAVAAASLRTSEIWKRLSDWVEADGGYVSSKLALVDESPCKSRGLVATSRISAKELDECPLIAVPERLYMTSDDAEAILFSRKPLFRLKPKLPAHARLAALLATERLKGNESRWHPYIVSLPDTPPNAWFYQSLSQLDARLDDLYAASSSPPLVPRIEWRKSIIHANLAMEKLSIHCINTLGRQSQLVEQDLMWALGQVLSRAFGSDEGLALAPLIDLLNHQHGASKPFPMVLDGKTYACVTSSRSSLCHESLAAMDEGEELYISYVKSRPGDMLETFLNFGFIC